MTLICSRAQRGQTQRGGGLAHTRTPNPGTQPAAAGPPAPGPPARKAASGVLPSSPAPRKSRSRARKGLQAGQRSQGSALGSGGRHPGLQHALRVQQARWLPASSSHSCSLSRAPQGPRPTCTVSTGSCRSLAGTTQSPAPSSGAPAGQWRSAHSPGRLHRCHQHWRRCCLIRRQHRRCRGRGRHRHESGSSPVRRCWCRRPGAR